MSWKSTNVCAPNGGQIFVSRMEGPALSVPFHGLGLGQNLRPWKPRMDIDLFKTNQRLYLVPIWYPGTPCDIFWSVPIWSISFCHTCVQCESSNRGCVVELWFWSVQLTSCEAEASLWHRKTAKTWPQRPKVLQTLQTLLEFGKHWFADKLLRMLRRSCSWQDSQQMTWAWSEHLFTYIYIHTHIII